MKNLCKFLSISFVLTVVLSVNSFAQTPKLGTYFCIYQLKDADNGTLTSHKTLYFKLRDENGVKTYLSFDEVRKTGSWTIDDKGVITFKHNGYDYFGDATAYPSKITPNRFHLKGSKKEKSVSPLTCDLVQTGDEQFKSSPIYGFVYDGKPLSQTDAKILRDDYFSIMSKVDGSTDSYVPPKPKTGRKN
ncbi:MAG: hypothetical protein HC846_10330 [Blastocatellia bacterium]|nr:hypothetical protein [Blastocatellia bacterium]